MTQIWKIDRVFSHAQMHGSMLPSILDSLHLRIQSLEQTFLVDVDGEKTGDYHVEPFDYTMDGIAVGCLVLTSPSFGERPFWYVVVVGRGDDPPKLDLPFLNEQLKQNAPFQSWVKSFIKVPLPTTIQMEFKVKNQAFGLYNIKMQSFPSFIQHKFEATNFIFGFAA